MNDTSDTQRIALVTGASRGIGRAAALALGKAGCHVILSARTAGGLEEVDDEIQAAGGSSSILKLNLAHGDKIDALGPTLYQRWQKLDVFVAAGGILGRLTPLSHLPTEGWDQALNINLTANWRLIRTLDPLLRMSDAGRALLITSHAAQDIRAYWGAYAVSKGATASTDPEAWTIVNGKLYLNFSPAIKKRWSKDIPGNIRKADKNWPGVLN